MPRTHDPRLLVLHRIGSTADRDTPPDCVATGRHKWRGLPPTAIRGIKEVHDAAVGIVTWTTGGMPAGLDRCK